MNQSHAPAFSCLLLCGLPASAHGETITLVREDNWYPYAALKDGKMSGLAVDVIEAAYAKMNIKVEVAIALAPLSQREMRLKQ